MHNLRDELRRLHADITLALEAVRWSAALIDRDGVVRWQNAVSTKLRGQRIGRTIAELVSPRDQAVVCDAIARILVGGEATEFTINALSAEGEYQPTEAELSGVPGRGGGAIVAILSLSHPAAPRQSTPSQPSGSTLTPRQLDVLRLLADGRSTREIASQLSLRDATVRNHVTGLIAALGVHTRLQAVVKAQKSGLLPT